MSFSKFPGGMIEVDYSSFLSQHDVVYQAPPTEGMDGLPIGNGDLGAILWSPPDHLHFNINKVDLFDDGPDGNFGSWDDDDNEIATMPRHAGSLSISNGLPGYDRLYLNDFEARLQLAEAQIDLRSVTSFSSVKAETFISQSAGVFVVHYQDETEEALPRTVELARWGTRGLLHWYSVIKRQEPLSLLGTQAYSDGEHIWIEQPLREMSFVIAAKVVGPVTPRVLHRRAGVFESQPVKHFECTVYTTVAHSEETADPLGLALQRVDRAAEQGLEALRENHRQTWANFWEASFVDLPPQQDYIENLWYLNNYMVGSACRGAYPPNHIYALWAWNRDVFPWAFYYHWNNQMHVYSLHSIGHPELAMPYFRYRRAMLEHAMADARTSHQCRGAFYTDVANRKGYQDVHPGAIDNLTPGPQIAAQFWQHYQFTQDKEFLKEYAFPVIREVALFYMDKISLREDGRYTFVSTQPYEGVLCLRETLTDLAHARQIFRIFLEARQILDLDAEQGERVEKLLDRIADYPTLQVSTEFEIPRPPDDMPDWNGDARPVSFKELRGDEPGMPIWLLGYKSPGSLSVHGQEIPDGTPIHEGSRNPMEHIWIFTSTNIAPVFPANQVGLDQKGSREFDTAVNVVKAFGYDTQSFSLYIIARARLGMADELARSLNNWPQRFQFFPQGFSHYFGVGNHQVADTPTRQARKVRVAGTNEHIYWPSSLSNHMSLEGGPILQLAVNEMLLQSYSGVLRVFPAVPRGWQGRFRLHAAGGFIVSAGYEGEAVSFLTIESRIGKPCTLINPYPGRIVCLYVWDNAKDGWALLGRLEGEKLEFPTTQESVHLILPEGKQPHSLQAAQITGQRNSQYKTFGQAQLGLPKGY